MKLSNSKYDKYFQKPSLETVPLKTQDSGDGNLPETRDTKAIIYKNKAEDGTSFEIDLFVVSQPTEIPLPAISENEDLYQIFFGGDLKNVREFDAEADIWLGPENEKHTIDSTSIIHITQDLASEKVEFKKVNKPIIFKNVIFRSK